MNIRYRYNNVKVMAPTTKGVVAFELSIKSPDQTLGELAKTWL